jgi:hypothetical protein
MVQLETLDLNNEIETLGATNVLVPESKPPPTLPVEKKSEKPPEKNINKEQKTMDSTPISDIMGSPEVMNGDPMMAQQMMNGAAPPVHMMNGAQPQQQVAQPAPPPPPPPQPTKSKNPLNLTDEQMEALIVGVISILVFSRPVQEKLGDFVPNFTGEDGRTMTGVVVTGLLAALIYFFARRFIVKQAS